MSIGKILNFVPRSEIAERRIARVLAKEAADEDFLFKTFPGISEPIKLGKTDSGMLGALELNPGTFNSQTGRGIPEWYAYFDKPKSKNFGPTIKGRNSFELGMIPDRDFVEEYGRDPEVFEAINFILKKNKGPSVFFADGSTI